MLIAKFSPRMYPKIARSSFRTPQSTHKRHFIPSHLISHISSLTKTKRNKERDVSDSHSQRLCFYNPTSLSFSHHYSHHQTPLPPRHHSKTHHHRSTTTIPSVSVSDISSSESWAPHSWTSKKALQLPDYPDPEELRLVLNTLESFPPIVFAGEARNLEERLAQAALGEAFLLQGGDCAESFKEFSADNIRDTFRVLLQMGIVLTYGAQIPVIKVRSGSLSLSFVSFLGFFR